MEILGLDAMTAVILGGLCMGTVEFIKRLFDKDWKAAVTIFCCGIVGGLAGMAMGINMLQGIAYGLAATGYITLAQNIGKNY